MQCGFPKPAAHPCRSEIDPSMSLMRDEAAVCYVAARYPNPQFKCLLGGAALVPLQQTHGVSPADPALEARGLGSH